MEEQPCTRTDRNNEPPRQEWLVEYRDLPRSERRRLARQQHRQTPRSWNIPLRKQP